LTRPEKKRKKGGLSNEEARKKGRFPTELGGGVDVKSARPVRRGGGVCPMRKPKKTRKVREGDGAHFLGGHREWVWGQDVAHDVATQKTARRAGGAGRMHDFGKIGEEGTNRWQSLIGISNTARRYSPTRTRELKNPQNRPQDPP